MPCAEGKSFVFYMLIINVEVELCGRDQLHQVEEKKKKGSKLVGEKGSKFVN